MKNLIFHEDQASYILNELLLIPEVKELDAVQKMVAALPKLVFFEYTEKDLEWSHFTTWFRAIALRDYKNPVINDLYYLHELSHVAAMAYHKGPNYTFNQWYRKMTQNETFAAVFSEAYIYHKLPKLRVEAFPFEIWVDRFKFTTEMGDSVYKPYLSRPGLRLGNHTHHNSFYYDFQNKTVFKEFYLARMQSMRNPDPYDFVEMQVSFYAMQNHQWATIWKDNWRRVETFFSDDPEEETHLRWLKTHMEDDGIPFREEAIRFKAVVEANKARQGNGILQS